MQKFDLASTTEPPALIATKLQDQTSTATTKVPRVPAESIGAELADELDVLFQRTLDQLESQIEQGDALESDLHELLGIEGNAALLNINPERSINPQATYRALADRLVQYMRPRLDPRGTRNQVRFDDLCVWLDEPLRMGFSQTEYLLRKIRFARGKSLRDLHQHILLRLTPESMPEDAATNACQELIRTLCVEVPPAIIIPVKETPPGTVLYMVLKRTDGDLSFHLSAYEIDRLAQSLLAFSTLAALAKNNEAANELTEAANSLRERMKRSKQQYEDKESIGAGRFVTLKMRRETIEFHVDTMLMNLFRSNATENMNRLEFIRQ